MPYKKATLTKRVARVEAQQRRQRPVMKHASFQVSNALGTNTANVKNICALATGSKVTERVGNKIKVFRVEIRGILDPGLDLYLVQAHTNDTPAISSFSVNRGPFLTPDNVNTKLTEWMHYSVPDINAHNFKRFVRFRNGIVVKYNGSATTNTTDNVLFVCTVNRSTSTQSVDCNIRIWYTDA